MKKMLAVFSVTACGLLILAGNLDAESAKDVAWEKYISSQKKLQVAFHHLMRLHWPHLKGVVKKSQKLQLLLADEKARRFYSLAESAPERIVRDRGFSAFVNFEWTQDDEARFLQDKDYAKLNKEIAELNQELDADPQYVELQNRFAGLEGEREMTEIHARFRFVSKEIEEILGGHKSPDFGKIQLDE